MVESVSRLFLVGFDCLSELGCHNGAPCFVVLLEKIEEPKFACWPNVGFEALANELASHFDSCEIHAAADVLQQVLPLGKRALLAVS